MGIHPVREPFLRHILCRTGLLTYFCSRKISPHVTESDTKTDYDYIIPVVDPSSIDLRCGRNASTAWSSPKTAVIVAGDTVGFAVNTSLGLPIEGAPVMPWDVRPTCSQCFPLSQRFGVQSPSSPKLDIKPHHFLADTLKSAGRTYTTPVLQRHGFLQSRVR
jgi:hypothetical protein